MEKKNVEPFFNYNELEGVDREVFSGFYLAHIGGVTMSLKDFTKLSTRNMFLWSMAKRLMDIEEKCFKLKATGDSKLSSIADDLAYQYGLVNLEEYCQALTEEIAAHSSKVKSEPQAPINWEKTF